MSNFRDRVAWAARAQTGLTRQRAAQGYAGAPIGTHAQGGPVPAYMNVHSHPSQQEACPQNVNDNRFSCQAGMCAEQPPVCGCNVIGANTLEDNGGLGLAPGATSNLAIDAGDSCRYQPRSLFIAAYAASAVTPGLIVNPAAGAPVLMLNATVGTIPMIRRTGQTSFGILSDAYSDRKELTCVDWAPFTSVQNQGLRLTFLQINETLNFHVFVVLWGDNLG